MADLGKAYVQIIPKAEGISGKIKSVVSPGASSAGISAGKNFVGGFAKLAGGMALGATVVKGLKAALDEGAKLQQSYGGLDTLYGEASAAAKEYAIQAAQAGISANDYAEQAVSFGASLKAAFGGDTAAAAEAANTAILDMADNAAKMGTSLDSIQNAYQGFAKGNYTMLDNLKLGYGGTKSEMERLLKDAQELTGVEYNMDNLGDVYAAIHAIQGDLGLTGVAAQEASETFSGSFAAMKAAGQNLLAMISTGGDVGPALQQFISSTGTFLFNNLIPMLGNIIGQLPGVIGTLIQQAAPAILEHGKALLANIFNGILTGLPQMAQLAADAIRAFADGFAPGSVGAQGLISKAGEMIVALGGALLDAIGTVIPATVDAIWTIYTTTDWLGLALSVGQTILDGFLDIFPKVVDFVGKVVADIMDVLGFHGLAEKVRKIFDDVKEKITGPINTAKELVSSAVETIKGLFPISMGKIFSGIKLPHFKISGGEIPWGIGGAGSPPSVDIEWYAKGGIMTRPTLFGGGEAGKEGIVPLDPFWNRLDQMADNIVNGVNTALAANAGAGGDTYITLYAYPGGPQMDKIIVQSYDRGKSNGLK